MQIRKKRPTLQDAHQFHKLGIYGISIEEYVSSEQLYDEYEKVTEQLRTICGASISKIRNIEFMVLKCHIITEFALSQYIRFHSRTWIEVDDLKHSYAQKLETAILLGLGATCPTLIPSLQLLNKARNQVAHTFKFEDRLVDELIRINSENYQNISFTKAERLKGLRFFAEHVCGMVSGAILCVWVESKRRKTCRCQIPLE